MRCWMIGIVMLLAGCATTQGNAKMHSVSMYNAGASAYNFRIDYGQVVLPYEPDGDDEFKAGGKRVYTDDMLIPAQVLVRWRTAPAPDGQELKYSVPLASLVTETQQKSELLTVGITVNGDRLEVRIGKNAREARLSAPVFQAPSGE